MSGSLKQMLEAYHGADKFMLQAIRKMNENSKWRQVVAHIMPAHTPGLTDAHPSICRWMREATVRILIYTHVDLVSDEALKYLLSSAEQADPTLAIIAVDTREADRIKSRKLNNMRDAFWGALLETNCQRALLCGMPNAGKSSIIYPLTKDSVLKTRKKKDRHQAKVSSTAGFTIGIKEHRLTSKQPLFLLDSPGLLPASLGEPQLLDAVVSAALPAAAGVSPKVWDVPLVLSRLLEGLHTHAEITNVAPPYVGALGMDGPTEDPLQLLHAYRESELNPMRKSNKTAAPSILTQTMLDIVRKGQLGQLLLLTPDGRADAVAAAVARRGGETERGAAGRTYRIKRTNETPVVYMNDRAEALIKVYKDYEKLEAARKRERKDKRGEEQAEIMKDLGEALEF